jgi:hypothetical protein
MPSNDTISRRSLLGSFATAIAAVPLMKGLPGLSAIERMNVQEQQARPQTNIADALKHPRTPDSMPGKFPGRVVVARDDKSWSGSAPDLAVLDRMLEHSLLTLTGASSITAAWRMFVTPDDIIGLKVNPVAGKLLSTSPEIVQVIIGQLEKAGISRKNIVIWDRRQFELYVTGFTGDVFPGIRITGTDRKDDNGSFRDKEGKLFSESVIDRGWFYWADVEEKYDEETFPYMVNEGKYSYFTGICTKELTKIINVPILKNAGSSVTLCMKNLAFGAITNTARLHKTLWHQTCAEVPAFPPLRDKVCLNIVDGAKGCYQGGPEANPQFITAFNTILVGTDPVAVDRIGYDIILKKRIQEKIQKEENPKGRIFMDLAQNLGLGTADIGKIDVTNA